jgi:hypothetical protein
VFTSTCVAESNDARYFALKLGATWTYEFRYWEEGRFAMEKVGEHIQWIDGTVKRGGHEYYRVQAKTTGFQNALDIDRLIRVAEDGVSTLETRMDPPEEILNLPLPAVPGRAWSVGEGAETWHYRLESAEPIEVPAGRFEDCIAIVDALESESSKFEISGRREYCAGVGMVRHRTMAIHEYGVSNGEYTLLEFKP